MYNKLTWFLRKKSIIRNVAEKRQVDKNKQKIKLGRFRTFIISADTSAAARFMIAQWKVIYFYP